MSDKNVTKTEIVVFILLTLFLINAYMDYQYITEFENDNDLINNYTEIIETKKKMFNSCMFDGVGWGTEELMYDPKTLYDYQIRCNEEQGEFDVIISGED